jgi:histidinol-phosphate/aromatic aminotransferase/cobyric acid decarboxylase-like protein
MNTKTPYIAQELSKHGIYVYDASNYFTQGYLRVSIGTKKENNRFLEVLENIMEE